MIRKKDERLYPCQIYPCVSCPFDSEEDDDGNCPFCQFASKEGDCALERTELVHLIRIKEPHIIDDYLRWHQECIETENHIS